jgi:uncharacterized protein YbcV (DUF1398 family)
MNIQAIHDTLAESHAGKLIFSEVVSRMLVAGVESYFVDVPRSEDIVYLNDGTTLVEKMHLPLDPAAEEFSKPGIVAAIRTAQRDEIRYPEFMRQATAAGVVAYWAFLTGKTVIYFGRKGEFHLENFRGSPSAVISTTRSVEIAKPAKTAYQFLSDPATMSRWAVHNVRSIELIGGDTWKIETPRGSGRFIPHFSAEFGILDHEFIDPQEGRWPASARIVPLSATASLYQLTLTKPDDMPDQNFWQGIPLVDDELQVLKTCIESIQ